MLRSRAQRGVSKHGQRYVWVPPFETRPTAAPQDEVWFVASIRSIYYFFLFRRRAIMFSPSISAEKAMAA
jgi:hypothetical protein